MSNIETHKNILVKLNLNLATSFTQYINLPFIPDVLEIKNISSFITNASVNISIRAIDLPIEQGNNQLFNLSTPIGAFYNVPYVNVLKLTGPINGTYNFQILNILDQFQQTTGQIQFYMNFIKYKK